VIRWIEEGGRLARPERCPDKVKLKFPKIKLLMKFQIIQIQFREKSNFQKIFGNNGNLILEKKNRILKRTKNGILQNTSNF